MSPRRIVEHTADVALHAEAKTLPELFAEAAAGLFEIIADIERAGVSYSVDVRVEADSLEYLMHDWLSELLFVHETESVILTRFDVSVTETAVTATVHGEKIDRARHVLKTEVKAVTYHMLKVVEEGDRWIAQILFDV